MRCAICGKEFGNGRNCQNCGTDRVTALGNYYGFSNSQINTPQSISSDTVPVDVDIREKQQGLEMCWNCSEPIPVTSKFCPMCGIKLNVECPKCGYQYQGRFRFCPECGTNREQFIKSRQEQQLIDNAIRITESREKKAPEPVPKISSSLRVVCSDSETLGRSFESINAPNTTPRSPEVEEFCRKAMEERLKAMHIKREEEGWESAVSMNTKAGYERFIKEYPDSIHKDDALQAMKDCI